MIAFLKEQQQCQVSFDDFNFYNRQKKIAPFLGAILWV
jgi:hypothetical protein